MILTDDQQKGLQIALDRYKNNKRYVVIAGYAGVGKSTLVRHIVDAIKPSNPIYCAYTGKACKVLQQKGNTPVSTLHKLLYEFYPREDGTFKQVPIDDKIHDLIVVDECSMLPKKIVDDLDKHTTGFIIFLGDPFQLPPPEDSKNEYSHLLDTPHVMLTQIMRQELDNEIIKFSMDVREGRELPRSYIGKNVEIYDGLKSVTPEMMLNADQILCSTNDMRSSINSKMRQLLGKSGAPQVGDKIICNRNNWNEFDTDGNALVNGTIGTIEEIYSKYYPLLFQFQVDDNKLPYYAVKLYTDDDTWFETTADTKFIENSKTPLLTYRQEAAIRASKWAQGRGITPPNQFCYAYAITVWKAQGGEWNNVLIIEEPNFPHPVKEPLLRRKCLYTALTRAQNKVILVRS